MKNIFFITLFFSVIVNAQWLQQNSGTTEDLTDVHFIDINLGWACSYNGKIIKTTDGGSNWLEQYSNTDLNLITIQFINQDIGWTAGDDQVLRTTDGGANWSIYNFSPPHLILSLQFINENIGWLLIKNPNGSYLYKSTNGGLFWTFHFDAGSDDFETMYFINGNIGWIIGRLNVYKTTNGGDDWTPNSNIFSGPPMCMEFINEQIGWLSHNTLGSTQISKTTNGGITWAQPYFSNTRFIQSIDFLNTDIGYAAGFKMQVPPNPNFEFVMMTTNGGTNWHEQYLDNGVLNSVFFVNDNLGWAVGNNGKIIHTINGGTPVELISFTTNFVENNMIINWSASSEINNYGFEIERSINKNDWIKIGFKEGKGTTTEQQNYSYTDDVSGINVPKLYYRLKQIDFDGSYEYSDVVEVTLTPMKFTLSQNYPNPFNPSTKISWQSPVGSWQTLKVYDVLGREVATLVDEYRNAGSYEVEFSTTGGSAYGGDGSRLASGVYYYRIAIHSDQLRVGEYVETRKMTLLK